MRNMNNEPTLVQRVMRGDSEGAKLRYRFEPSWSDFPAQWPESLLHQYEDGA
jgi:hypothetical protein